MSSTEFTVGKEDGRNSSRVLRPPGGGSSDIFNVGPYIPTADKNPPKNIAQAVTQMETTPTHSAGKRDCVDTMSRVFNVPSQETSKLTPLQAHSAGKKEGVDTMNRVFNVPSQGTSNIPPPQAHSAYVVRNPITGEGYNSENPKKKVEKSGKDGKLDDQNTTETAKAVQTSIRVRNPPGGKSSGFF